MSFLIAKMQAWRRYRVCLRELQQLTDAELAELELNRNEIDNVARDCAGR